MKKKKSPFCGNTKGRQKCINNMANKETEKKKEKVYTQVQFGFGSENSRYTKLLLKSNIYVENILCARRMDGFSLLPIPSTWFAVLEVLAGSNFYSETNSTLWHHLV